MDIEQRKYVRFLPQDNTFAALRKGFEKVGKVNDVSIKGLAFSYLSETVENGPDPYSYQVDIFLLENKCHLSNVPCKIVYDAPDPTNGKNYSIKMYRCGLLFKELTKIQSELLESFINKHTTGIL
ncbi:MAG: PilZ domain-containing protein [Proteobacteria bacterium]|nr:PilZ domain-containing protein [Pseudomonadota bacterium]